MQCPNESHGDKRKERYFIDRKERHRRVGRNMLRLQSLKIKVYSSDGAMYVTKLWANPILRVVQLRQLTIVIKHY